MSDPQAKQAAPANLQGPHRSIAGHSLADWAVPAFIFLFCGVISYIATTLDEAPDIIVGDAMQPRVFPIFLMAVIAIFNVVLIIQMLRSEPRSRSDLPWQTWVTGALLAVFYVVTVNLDLFLALAIVMFSMCIAWGERRIWVAALVATITPAVIFFTFDLVLRVRFPRGILTNLYYG